MILLLRLCIYHFHHVISITRELGLVEAVEEEEEEENLEVDHYFRRTVQSSLNQKKYNCRCRLLFISVEKYAKVYYWTI